MEFKSSVVCFLPLYGSHNSEKLFECYDLTINKFQIQTKLCRITTDSASNNIKALKNFIIPGFKSLTFMTMMETVIMTIHQIVIIVVQVKVMMMMMMHMTIRQCP